MKETVKYIRIILSYIHGLILCVFYSLLPKRKLICCELHPRVIVSLTSYGRRASRTLKYSVLSMLHQTRMPDRIVVWLNEKTVFHHILKNIQISMELRSNSALI